MKKYLWSLGRCCVLGNWGTHTWRSKFGVKQSGSRRGPAINESDGLRPEPETRSSKTSKTCATSRRWRRDVRQDKTMGGDARHGGKLSTIASGSTYSNRCGLLLSSSHVCWILGQLQVIKIGLLTVLLLAVIESLQLSPPSQLIFGGKGWLDRMKKCRGWVVEEGSLVSWEIGRKVRGGFCPSFHLGLSRTFLYWTF